MKRTTLLLLTLFFPVLAFAQTETTTLTEKEEVRAAIDRLFDGMRAGDSTAVRSFFYEGATLYSHFSRQGAAARQGGSVDRFVQGVGSPHDQVWNEKVWNVDIKIDDLLASAWMDYAFYLDEDLSHCGVNSIQFFKSDDGWKATSLVDTRRQDCERPPPPPPTNG